MTRLLPLLAAASLSIPTLAADPHPPTLIRNATIIDVAEGKPLPNRTLLVRNGVIESITSGIELVVPPEGATVIDASGLYLIPGLFDAHVHYVSPETFGPLMIASGVTHVRDLGGATESILATRDQLNAGTLLGPRMVATGAIIDGDPPVWPFSEPCTTEEQARAAVRKLHAAGVDQIKVYSRLAPDVYRAAVDEARTLGLKAVGHIPDACTVEDALAAGQAGVEHFSRVESMITALLPEQPGGRRPARGFGQMRAWASLDDVPADALSAELDKLAKAGVHQTPTLVVIAGISALADPDAAAKDPLLAYVPAEMRAFWSGEGYASWAQFAGMLIPPMQRMTKAMHDAGVPLMVGTDLANPHVFAGFSLHREMQLWADAGIPPADILRAATLTPATFCGVADEYGTIAEGKRASLVLLTANPLEDIASASKIHTVLLDGRIFDRAALDELLAGVRRDVAARAPAPVAEGDLDLPGEVIARGRYKLTFGQWDAGAEEFVIARTDDGFAIKSRSQPRGGPMPPSTLTVHAGPDRVIRSATFTEHTAEPLTARYSRDGDTFRVEAVKGDAALPPATLDAPAPWLFTAPTYSGDFLALGAADLQVGQTRELTAIGFGWSQPTWGLGATPTQLTRHEDTTLTHNGAEIPVRRYTGSMTTPMGVIKSETLTDATGLPIRSTVTLPFGTLTAELQ